MIRPGGVECWHLCHRHLWLVTATLIRHWHLTWLSTLSVFCQVPVCGKPQLFGQFYRLGRWAFCPFCPRRPALRRHQPQPGAARGAIPPLMEQPKKKLRQPPNRPHSSDPPVKKLRASITALVCPHHALVTKGRILPSWKSPVVHPLHPAIPHDALRLPFRVWNPASTS